ncbi:MAG: hypothetical protein V1650_02805 [Candidatus Omnitrophota bacterium]
MRTKEEYLTVDFLCTFLLLCSAGLLFGGALKGEILYLLLGLIAGFCFSWVKRETKVIKITSDILGLIVMGWALYSVFTSTLVYEDVVLILAKAVLVLSVVLSFNASSDKVISSIQGLSLPLFLISHLFIRSYDLGYALLILVYLASWCVIIKLKFYHSFDSLIAVRASTRHSIIISSVFFLVVLTISWALFSNILLGKIRKGGVFIYKESRGLLNDESFEKEYYDTQDKLQGKIIDSPTDFDKESALQYFSMVMNSENVQEVKKAAEGLIDLFRRPGPGLEKGDKEVTLLLINNYIDKRTQKNLNNMKNKINDSLKANAVSVFDRMSVMNNVSKLQAAGSPEEFKEARKQLREALNNSSMDAGTKSELAGLVEQLEQWKAFELARQNIGAEEELLAPEPQVVSPPVPLPQPQGLSLPQEQSGPKKIMPAMLIIAIISAGCLLILIIIMAVFYMLTKKEQKRLENVLRNSPRDFIVGLYINFINVLNVFGVKYMGNLAPVAFSRLFEEKCQVDKGAFLNLTLKFLEAKYSRHDLAAEDAHFALNDYNDSLRILNGRYGKTALFFKNCFALMRRRPTFIKV